MNYKVNTKEEFDLFVINNYETINQYLENKKSGLPIPFYSSVDVRESKTKYAPVDHNMYPAGFNNICSADYDNAICVIKKTIQGITPDAKRVGIIPESHTKNLFYLDHLATLGMLITNAGYEVVYLTFDNTLFEKENQLDLVSQDGSALTIYKASLQDGLITGNNQVCDFVVCNNDQSNPLPVDWKNVKTPINPTPLIGWFRRQKNTHFKYYKIVADEFCAHFGINPDLIQAKFATAENVDFENKSGLEELGKTVDDMLATLPENSKVFVKASQGTYGMGISVVSSGEEIINMNRKTRNKMDVGKNAIKFTSLLIQEGVETIIKYDDMPAEITIYLVNCKAIGGFMRINGEKDTLGNLNSRGMIFKKLCMCNVETKVQDYTIKEAVYSLIARLAVMASAYEIKEVI